jgi:hypothetical protein
VIEVEIAGELAELFSRRDAAKRIFRRDLRQLQRRLHHPVKPCAGKIARVRAGRALSEEDADADRFRPGLFQGLDLTEAHERGEFVTLADNAFGGGGAASHGAADDVLRDFAEISCLRSVSLCFNRWHSKSFVASGTS